MVPREAHASRGEQAAREGGGAGRGAHAEGVLRLDDLVGEYRPGGQREVQRLGPRDVVLRELRDTHMHLGRAHVPHVARLEPRAHHGVPAVGLVLLRGQPADELPRRPVVVVLEAWLGLGSGLGLGLGVRVGVRVGGRVGGRVRVS